MPVAHGTFPSHESRATRWFSGTARRSRSKIAITAEHWTSGGPSHSAR